MGKANILKSPRLPIGVIGTPKGRGIKSAASPAIGGELEGVFFITFTTMKFSYSKAEKLKSRKVIESLFTEGKSVGVFPLRLFYIEIPESDASVTKTAVTVSKKNFRLAVHRIKIKRLLREAFRLNKHLILENASKKYALLFLYVGKEMPQYHQLDASIKKLMHKFTSEQQTEESQLPMIKKFGTP